MNKDHKYYSLAKKWLEGTEVQKYSNVTKSYLNEPNPTWLETEVYREKPIKPEVKWKPKYSIVTAYINSKLKNVAVPKKVNTYDTLLQFVKEFETDWHNQDHEVYEHSIGNKFSVVDMHYDKSPSLGTIRMSKICGEKLRDMLNSGEVEL